MLKKISMLFFLFMLLPFYQINTKAFNEEQYILDVISEEDDVTLYRVNFNEFTAFSTVSPDPYFYNWDYGPITSEILYMSDVGFVYCIDADKYAPMSPTEYEQIDFETTLVMQKVLYHGFPHNASNLKEKYNISDSQAYVRTGIALRTAMNPDGYTYFNGKYFNREIIESYQDPYINELLDIAFSQDISNSKSLNLGQLGPYNLNFKEDSHQLIFNEERLSLKTQKNSDSNTVESGEDFFFEVNDLDNKLNERITTKDLSLKLETKVYRSQNPNLQRVSYLHKYYEPLELYVNYEPEVRNLRVTKEMENIFGDLKKPNDLSGFEFSLYQVSTQDDYDVKLEDVYLKFIESKVTNSSGHIDFELFLHHNYYVKETNAPNYAKISKEYFLVDNDSIVIKNQYQPKTISIKKTLSEDVGLSIANFSFGLFRLVDYETEHKFEDRYYILVDQGVTDENGYLHFENLDINTHYYIYELSAPSYAVKIDNLIDVHSILTDVHVEIENQIAYDQVKIIKQDGYDLSLLSGAVFEILKCNGDLVGTVTTDINGEALFSVIVDQCYMIKEVVSPVGYSLNDREILLDNIDTYENSTKYVVVKNYPIEHPLTLVETGKKLKLFLK